MKAKIVLLPLSIPYLGRTYVTKALKCTYSRGNVLYKVALPSVIAPVSQCWFTREGLSWTAVMGQGIAPALLAAIRTALQALHQPKPKSPKAKPQTRLTYA
jgi:hypothetical protein